LHSPCSTADKPAGRAVVRLFAEQQRRGELRLFPEAGGGMTGTDAGRPVAGNSVTEFCCDPDYMDELKQKIAISIQRIKEHEPKEGYYLAFSGGKDSTVILDLAQKAGVKFDAYFNRTTVDPPEVIEFIKKNYPKVIWIKPRRSMFQLIISQSCLPTRTHRFCCRGLKETGGKGRVVITGIRWEESTNRAGRPIFHESNRVNKKWFLNHIIDWTTTDVWDYIAFNQIPHCRLYDEGQTRIGCILCPFKPLRDKLEDIRRYPKFVNAYKNTTKKLFKILQDRGRLNKKWKSPEDLWEWWIYGENQDHLTKQERLS
jgi:phosphoadenosine phosphosulfate reductase